MKVNSAGNQIIERIFNGNLNGRPGFRLILFALFSASFFFINSKSAFAIYSARCPDQIQVDLRNFRQLPSSQIDPDYWRYVTEVDPKRRLDYELLGRLSPLRRSLPLFARLHGRCAYGQREPDLRTNGRILLMLKGTHENPYVQIHYTVMDPQRQAIIEYTMISYLAHYSREGIVTKRSDYAPLSIQIVPCDYAQCRPKQVLLGYSASVHLQ